MKYCPHCKQDLPLSEFGIDRRRPDGLNGYCKTARRQRNEAFRREKKRFKFGRKPHQMAKKRNLTPAESVMLAIGRGAKTQEQIQRVTRLHEDVVSDALADLWDENRLNRTAIRNRIYLAA